MRFPLAMKTVRFQQLVETAGKPETHLVLIDPAKDRALQAAVKANRVVTVYQPATGARTDHGTVGFDPGPSRQYLIFPRGVGRFKARRIVGIKYDLFAGESSPKKSSRSSGASRKYPPLRVLEKPEPAVPAHLEKSRAAPDKRAANASEKRGRERIARARAKEEQAKRARDERERKKRARAEAKALAALAGRVRKALNYLEAGRREPALKILRRTLEAQP